ncbi:unnamed protein product [Spirodela intermedia]|uniref:Uncharacterized protein n=2 Tax=Spirodela intermedia TaxID=51605 RepID=A0A7I8KL49_SPIIN|nr:unnamed protein product [Spirodela intermedia]CAA6662126.1 unnamed protein product [Spirodela intermedia]CAA7398509.1 unnamed protein product [Spirodela intermedia]
MMWAGIFSSYKGRTLVTWCRLLLTSNNLIISMNI